MKTGWSAELAIRNPSGLHLRPEGWTHTTSIGTAGNVSEAGVRENGRPCGETLLNRSLPKESNVTQRSHIHIATSRARRRGGGNANRRHPEF